MTAALLMLMYWQPNSDIVIQKIAQSGRVIEAIAPSERLRDPGSQVSPGAPPILAFRYFDGAARHRFGNLDLMVDDAGH